MKRKRSEPEPRTTNQEQPMEPPPHTQTHDERIPAGQGGVRALSLCLSERNRRDEECVCARGDRGGGKRSSERTRSKEERPCRRLDNRSRPQEQQQQNTNTNATGGRREPVKTGRPWNQTDRSPPCAQTDTDNVTKQTRAMNRRRARETTGGGKLEGKKEKTDHWL